MTLEKNAREFLDCRDRLLSFMEESLRRPDHAKPPPGSNLDSFFNRLAIDLFDLQFRNNPAYRLFCQSRRINPSRIEQWRQIPALPASAFKELEASCLSPAQRIAVFHSSGTTEQRPSRHFHSASSLALYEASLLKWFWAGTSLLEHAASQAARQQQMGNRERVFLALTPPAREAPHSSLVHMFHILISRSGSPESLFAGAVGANGSWILDLNRIWRFLDQMEAERRPAILLGTASLWLRLLEGLEEAGKNYHLAAGSFALETGGFKGQLRRLPRQTLYQMIEQRLRIPASEIVSEYGMSELSSQAYDWPNGMERLEDRVFRFPPWVKVEIINPENEAACAEPGQAGLIRVYDLANLWSVMAIQTEDLGEIRPGGFTLKGRNMNAEPRGCSLMTHEP